MTDPVAELRTLLHRAVDRACDILQQQQAPTQGRTAEGAPTSHPAPPPPSIRAPGRARTTSGPRSRGAVTAARVYFNRRERQWRDVPADVTWESWLASTEGAAWLRGESCSRLQQVAAASCSSELQQVAAGVAAAPSFPSHSPSSSENSGGKKEEEGARKGGMQQVAAGVAAPGCSSRLQQVAAATPSTGLEILAQASKGRVSVLASGKDQLALMVALGDVGLRGLADLEAFGRALAGDGASKLWPRSAAACGKAALTPGFFLGRDGNARMLADGVTRWREQQARDASLTPGGNAAPAPTAPPGPVLTEAEKGRRMREAFARAGVAPLAQQGGGVAHA